MSEFIFLTFYLW